MDSGPKRPVPVFPLPDVVLFPHIEIPLYVFELRYRTMVREALSGERLLALAVLAPGWERDYHGSPEFHPLACLARFEEVEWLPNDCYNLRIRGLARVRLGRVTREFPYRAARAEIRPQDPYTEDDPLVQIERRALASALTRLETAGESAAAVIRPGVPTYETLVNAGCMTLDLGPR